MLRRCCCALVLACVAAAGNALASEPRDAQARAQFSAGSEAFRAQDYAAALDAFRAAAAAGLRGPAVYYNIGVCAWQLGLLDEAEDAFRVVAEHPPMAATAYYNLGLVSLDRKDDDTARAWFARARAETADEGLRRLATLQLEALGRTPDATQAIPGPVVFLAAQAGYDDNVALVADGEILGVSGTESAYADLQLAAVAPLGAHLRLEASAFLLRYAELNEFDQAGALFGLVAHRAFGSWSGELGAGYGINQLDGDRFEDRRALSLTALRKLDAAWDLRLRYRFEDITGREAFTGLSGDRHEASIRLRRHSDPHGLRIEYRFETNDRAADSVSPERHRIEAEWTLGRPGKLQTTLGAGWRHSSYALPEGNESERQGFASAGLRGPLTGRWMWTARYDWVRNSATTEAYDYTRQRVFAGIEAVF